MSIRLKDIAERSGVSLQTVGHILGKRAHLFRPETRERVLLAAQELGYRRNTAARSMRTGRFDCIAVLQSAGHVLQGSVLNGALDALADANTRLVVATLPDEKLTSEGFVPYILRELCVDGMLICYDTLIPSAMIDLIHKHRIPAVWMNSRQKANCVTLDYRSAGRMAAEQLRLRGHGQIGFLNYASALHYSGGELLSGLKSAASKHPIFETIERCVPLKRDARIADAEAWLKQRPEMSAVYTYSEVMAAAVLIAAARIGRRVPDDLSVVSMSSELPSDSGKMVACTLLDNAEMGRQAARMLLKRIQHPDVEIPPQVVAPLWVPAGTVRPLPHGADRGGGD